jgi:aryl-alcohol dehydrogenase-like predicted oxidoreductase
MEYRFLGNTGLKVSVLSFGNWLTSNKREDIDRNISLVKQAYEAGINYFDTAEGYGAGEGEIQFGEALKALGANREEIVVSTKIFWGGKLNELGLSRKHIIEGAQRSLKRLGLDYVDIIFAHRYDYEVPIEEVCRAFNYLIEKGLTFYWGTSEWTAEQIRKAYVIIYMKAQKNLAYYFLLFI